MSHERWLQDAQAPIDKPRVVFQGTAGSFSESASYAYFGNMSQAFGLPSFKDAIEALVAGQADYAILPIENSSTGAITEVYDLIAHYPVCVVGERIIEITQNLLALPGADLQGITTVYSHPQGLSQSKDFLTNHSLQGVSYNDTAMAAEMVAKKGDPSLAAIASARAAQAYGLNILVPHVNFSETNQTRFFVLRTVPECNPKQNKVSLVFKTPHKPGALFDALRYFSNGHYDMTRIESRPVPGKPWEYAFYIDLMGSCSDSFFIGTLNRVREATVDYHFLGAYASAQEKETIA